MPLTSKQSLLYFVLLFVIVVPLFWVGLANHGLWTADEPRVAEIGREMALSGNWAVPTLNQKPFLEQPPLYYASLAAVFRVFGGPSDTIARIPSTVFALGGVAALFFLGNLLFGPRTGFISALAMATCGEYFRVAHWVIVDSALTCFVVLSLDFFMIAYLSDNRRKRFIFYGLCYICCTLGFYTKGFIGVVIPGIAILAFLIFDGNARHMLKMHLWLGFLIFLTMTIPWFLSLWHQGSSEYLRVFFVHNHLERFAGGSTGHRQPFYYYLIQFPVAFLPWSVLAAPALYRSLRRSDREKGRAGKGILLMLCWFLAGFIFLSTASTKRALYLMPVFAPISLLIAVYIDAAIKGTVFEKWEKVFICSFGILPLLAGIAVVPGLVVASKKLGFYIPPRILVLTISFAVVAIVFSVTALWNHRSDMLKFWGFSSAAILSLLFLGLIAAMPILDQFKSFVPFCQAVKGSVSSSDELYVWRPDETVLGAIPFYTGHFLKEIDSIPQLTGALERKKTVFVIVRDKNGKMEAELLSTGKMTVLFRQAMGTDRSLAILQSKRDGTARTTALPAEGEIEQPVVIE